jgi:hypothetical protein
MENLYEKSQSELIFALRLACKGGGFGGASGVVIG